MAHDSGFCLPPVLYHLRDTRMLSLLIPMPASATEALPAANLPQGKVASLGSRWLDERRTALGLPAPEGTRWTTMPAAVLNPRPSSKS